MNHSTNLAQFRRRQFSSSKHQMHEKRSIKSLALSVYFKQPDLGMTDYEILSRASAFLLAVDPPPPTETDSPYAHLGPNARERTVKLHKQHSRYTPAGHPGDNRARRNRAAHHAAPLRQRRGAGHRRRARAGDGRGVSRLAESRAAAER